jgi:hypothetical protein
MLIAAKIMANAAITTPMFCNSEVSVDAAVGRTKK